MADDEARRAEVVDELLGRVQRPAQPDLVAHAGERVPARDRRAGVDERDVGALEHRQRLGGLGAQRAAERGEHVGRASCRAWARSCEPQCTTTRAPAAAASTAAASERCGASVMPS